MTPISKMHALYGRNDNETCATCCNLVVDKHSARRSVRCCAYGMSVRGDWRQRAVACGLHGQWFAATGLKPVARGKPMTARQREVFGGQLRLDI